MSASKNHMLAIGIIFILLFAVLAPPVSAGCVYEIENQWSSGFVANIYLTNDTADAVNSWHVSWQYNGDNRTTNGWNADISGNNPYSASNLAWNGTIEPGETISFGLQGTLNDAAEIPVVTGSLCGDTNTDTDTDTSTDTDTDTDTDTSTDTSTDTDTDTSTDTDNTTGEADWLHTDGNRIVDANGRTVWLTGANWFGFNCSERIFHGLWSVNLEAALEDIAKRGINLLRIPISTQLLAEWMTGDIPQPVGINYYANAELEGMDTLEIFDRTLELCEKYGLKVLLDVHSAEANNSGHVLPMWYTESIPVETFYATWQWVAARYKDNDTVIAFDLENEPHGKPNEIPRAKWDNSTDQDNWKYVFEEASKRIFAENPNVLVLCEGIEVYPKEGVSWTETNAKKYHSTWWGGNLRGVADFPVSLGPNQDQLVYSPHDYGPLVWPQTWFDGDFTMDSLYNDVWYPNWFFIQKNNTAPLLIGEWGGRLDGDDNEKWLNLLRDFIQQHHIHHTFWCINPNSGDTGGLLDNDWVTWDEAKYQLVEPVFWQDADGKFVGLDHDVPLGGTANTTGISLNHFYANDGTPPNP